MEPPWRNLAFRKAGERLRIPVPRGLWEGLGGEEFTGGVEPLMLNLERGVNSGQFTRLHSGHEFVLCLNGSMDYEVEGQRFSLDPADSLLFSAQLEHRWRNSSSAQTQVWIILSGFNKGESPLEYHLITG